MKPVAIALGLVAGLVGLALAARAARAREPRPVDSPPKEASTAGAPAPAASTGPLAASAGDEAAGPVVVPPPSAKALRYYRSGNAIWAFEQLLGLALPALLLFSGLSARLRTLAASLGRGHLYPTLAITLTLLVVVVFVVQLPLTYYVGYAREHAYGLSTQRFSKWATDQLKGLALGVVVGAAVIWIPYLLLARSPSRWWLWTGALSRRDSRGVQIVGRLRCLNLSILYFRTRCRHRSSHREPCNWMGRFGRQAELLLMVPGSEAEHSHRSARVPGFRSRWEMQFGPHAHRLETSYAFAT